MSRLRRGGREAPLLGPRPGSSLTEVPVNSRQAGCASFALKSQNSFLVSPWPGSLPNSWRLEKAGSKKRKTSQGHASSGAILVTREAAASVLAQMYREKHRTTGCLGERATRVGTIHVALCDMVPARHLWQSGTWAVTVMTEEVDLLVLFDFTVFKLKLK